MAKKNRLLLKWSKMTFYGVSGRKLPKNIALQCLELIDLNFIPRNGFGFFFARNSKIFSENIEMRLKMDCKNYVLRSHTFLKRGISSVCLLSCFLSMTFQIYSFCLCFFIEYFDWNDAYKLWNHKNDAFEHSQLKWSQHSASRSGDVVTLNACDVCVCALAFVPMFSFSTTFYSSSNVQVVLVLMKPFDCTCLNKVCVWKCERLYSIAVERKNLIVLMTQPLMLSSSLLPFSINSQWSNEMSNFSCSPLQWIVWIDKHSDMIVIARNWLVDGRILFCYWKQRKSSFKLHSFVFFPLNLCAQMEHTTQQYNITSYYKVTLSNISRWAQTAEKKLRRSRTRRIAIFNRKCDSLHAPIYLWAWDRARVWNNKNFRQSHDNFLPSSFGATKLNELYTFKQKLSVYIEFINCDCSWYFWRVRKWHTHTHAQKRKKIWFKTWILLNCQLFIEICFSL